MTTNVKSISEQLFTLIIKDYPIGVQLTSGDLKTTANIHGIKCSMGAVSGFMNRAVEKGVFKLIGAIIIDAQKNKKTFLYQVLNHDAWDFKAPGKGSPVGRSSKGYNLPDVPLLEYEGTHNGEKITVVESKPEPKAKVQFGSDKAVKDWADKCVADGTVEDEIILRLAEVMALIEAQRGVRTDISAFSDDEIADEVKRRFHKK